MINRLMNLAMVPVWAWMLLAVVTGLGSILVVVVLVVGGTAFSMASDLHYQCDSAVGADPADTETAVPTTSTGSGARSTASANSVSAMPTTNPYARLAVAPEDTGVSDWQRACVSALKSAPYQMAPLQTGNAGFSAECARKLAIAQVGRTSAASADGSDDPATTAAGLVRSVIYQASAAAVTSRCEMLAGATASPEVGLGAQESVPAEKLCGRPAETGAESVTILPRYVAGQASCGQRVDQAAVSAGDLVFWNYRDSAPTRVGISVGAAQLVTIDPATRRTVQEAMPTGRDVRVKRVLGGGP